MPRVAMQDTVLCYLEMSRLSDVRDTRDSDRISNKHAAVMILWMVQIVLLVIRSSS